MKNFYRFTTAIAVAAISITGFMPNVAFASGYWHDPGNNTLQYKFTDTDGPYDLYYTVYTDALPEFINIEGYQYGNYPEHPCTYDEGAIYPSQLEPGNYDFTGLCPLYIDDDMVVYPEFVFTLHLTVADPQ